MELIKCDGCGKTHEGAKYESHPLWRSVIYTEKGRGKKEGEMITKDFCTRCSRVKGI